MSNYRTLHEFGTDEITIEKSVFIGYAKPIKSEEEALEFINEIKKKHKDATHNVWAYTVGKNMNIQRYSDDGEPQGTAGIPTLEVIKKEDLRDVAVVVTRYFGGTKLGAGGLVRAYTKGAKLGLEAGKIIYKVMYQEVKVKIDYTQLGKVVVVTRYFGGTKLGAGGLVRAYTKGTKLGLEAGKIIYKVMYQEVKVKIDYTQLGKVQNELMNLGYFIKDTVYEDNVEIVVYSRLEDVEKLSEKMIDITSGTGKIVLGEEFYLSEQNGEILI
ncbi:YigZ family protein [Clostridioides difficile]|nr:YigZ family protein [Clostridioides difficile]